MMRRNREINIFSLSALDLFASAMGAFIIIAVMLFPFYQHDMVTLKELKEAQRQTEEARKKAEEAQKKAEEAQKALLAFKPKDLDIVMVMDTTSSMAKSITTLKNNLKGIVRVLKHLTNTLRVGFVAYRDHGDDYLTKNFPLTDMTDEGVLRLQRFIDTLTAGGGGDDPEAMEVGIAKALADSWRPDAHSYILVVADAPPHDKDIAELLNQVDLFVGKNDKRRLSTIFSGEEEAFFKKLAKHGRGHYLRDSGALFENILISTIKD